MLLEPSVPLEDVNLLGDGFDELLGRTVGRWQVCPLWVLRGKMFSLAEKALVIALLDLWHTAGRPEWFYGTNDNLTRLSGMSHRAFQVARAQLLRKCVIETKPGRRGRPKIGAVNPATAYKLSQDFLYQLSKEQPLPLETRSYSVGDKVAVFRKRNLEI